jgi:hypothetical protein
MQRAKFIPDFSDRLFGMKICQMAVVIGPSSGEQKLPSQNPGLAPLFFTGLSPEASPSLLPILETLVDPSEIQLLESSFRAQAQDPLQEVYRYRAYLEQQDEAFGEEVEALLSRPFIQPQVRAQGLRWLRAKMKIDQFQKKEQEAARVIAEYAYRIFEKNPQQVQFQIQSKHLSVDVKIFELGRSLTPSHPELA